MFIRSTNACRYVSSRNTGLLSNCRFISFCPGKISGFQRVSVCSRRSASTSHQNASVELKRTRNIGIIAHIDAGKTTTTERMLYYSGHTRRIGDVDDGSTVTDFLPAERARGITIQSAAITFKWPPTSEADDNTRTKDVLDGTAPKSSITHHINLIDTPGHADFTFEVRRSLRVLDGAICILDGVAGVEAQTEQVWKQAAQWKIPRIAYVNKLDRDGAAFGKTVREIGVRLGGWPAVCHVPWWENGKGRFTGIGDVVNLQALLYEPGDGKAVIQYSMNELEGTNVGLAQEIRRARVALVELLSEYDDGMVEAFLEAEEDHQRITPQQILDSLRRCVLRNDGVLIPVFAGASFRNIGVQPLLDSVLNLLPDPSERPDPEISLGSVHGGLQQLLDGKLSIANISDQSTKPKKKGAHNLASSSPRALEGCALAFKVVNDPRKGLLVYIRVYSGSIDRNAVLYNTNLHVSERATSLLRMYASDSVPVQSIEAGQIGVIVGSKYARTGDTLISYTCDKTSPPEPLGQLQLRPIEVPPPVFFASIEPNSLREERDMRDKLNLLLREDPSLQVTQDLDTGQTLLSGMGELHLEIARDRLVNDLKANATMGKIEIGYRETLLAASNSITKVFDDPKSDSRGKAGCTATVQPLKDEPPSPAATNSEAYYQRTYTQDGNRIVINAPNLDDEGQPRSPGDPALPSNISIHELTNAYLNGALAALSRGPKFSYQMRDTLVVLTIDTSQHLFGNETTLPSLTSAARLTTIAALKDTSSSAGSALMEPVMNVDISVDDAHLGPVIQDISASRGGHIVSLGGDDDASASASANPAIDVSRIYAPPDPFESSPSSVDLGGGPLPDLQRSIQAKVPLKEMVGYLKHLRSITGGRGTFVMSVDRFEKMNAQRERSAVAELRGG